MRMKRLISVLLALCLLTSSLCSLAEGVPAAPGNPAGGAGTTVNVVSESTENFLSVDVKYAETEWDGLLHATVAVSWPATNAQEAENVQLTIELFDGLEMQEGDTEISLGKILPGGTKLAQFTLRFDHSVEKPDYIPEPEMILTAWADGIGYTCYTARMDGTTRPRMKIIGADPNERTPNAIQEDLQIMDDLFSDSWYNGQPFDIPDPTYNDADFIAAIQSLQGWGMDENDITYVYVNAHGAESKYTKKPLGAFEAYYQKPYFIEEENREVSNAIPYGELVKVLNESIKGRVVLIMDTCYSGKLILEAMEQEVDPEKFSIISTTDANNPGYSWPGLYIEGEDWKLKIFSAYGWVANDIREVIEKKWAEDENGVVSVESLATHIASAWESMLLRIEKDGLENFIFGENEIEESEGIEAFNGLVESIDAEALETFRKTILQIFRFISPWFWGKADTLLYCSNPEYDDGKRKLVVLEEKIEYMDPVELYYAYLNEWVVPEIGIARRDDRFTGKDSWEWDEAYWAELLYMQGFSGLLSAAVCDLDKNGSLDMITLSIMPREQALIEATNVYYSINLEMYQIEKGVVVRSDLREDVLYIGEEANGIWSKMNCRLVEFEDQLIFRTHCYSTPGMSGIGDWAHYFDCTFMDGKIVDGAPSTYRAGHQAQTENGEIYLTPDYDDDVFEHMGDGIAAVEACFDTMEGAQYNATDATKLYEYIFGYEKPKAYKPLKVLSVPLQASRSDEVIASIRQSVADAMSAAGKKAYFHNISCNEDTEEFRQSIIYSDEWDYEVIDTENLRAVALAILTAPEVNAPEAVVSAMRDFEFAEVNRIEWEGSGWMLTFMMIPDGTYSLIIDCEE